MNRGVRMSTEICSHTSGSPLKGLISNPPMWTSREIDSLHQQWLRFRQQREESNPDAYRSFLQRVQRSWAIETGIIEGLYNIDRGTTQTLGRARLPGQSH